MDLKISRNFIIACSGLSLLFLMMVFISEFYALKIVLMLLLIILIRKYYNISTNVIIVYFLIILYGLFGIVVGIINQAPRPFIFVTIYCIYPFLYIIFSLFLTKDVYFKLIAKTIFIAHVFIVFYDLLFAWGTFNGFDVPNIYVNYSPFAIYDNATRMNFVNLNTLTFSMPVLFVLFIGKYDFGISRVFQFIVLAFTFFMFIISGRRSVMLVMVILPFMPLFFSSFFPSKIKKILSRSSIIFLFLLIATYGIVNKFNSQFIEDYSQVFLNAFDSDVEPIKFAQKETLMANFLEKPFFGHGAGSLFYEPYPGRMVLADQFELSYHLKLATTGVFGFIIIISVYLYILLYGFYISRKKNDLLFLSFLIGFFFMLIADATNPVLCSFDLIWPIYLCLARINYWELNKVNSTDGVVI